MFNKYITIKHLLFLLLNFISLSTLLYFFMLFYFDVSFFTHPLLMCSWSHQNWFYKPQSHRWSGDINKFKMPRQQSPCSTELCFNGFASPGFWSKIHRKFDLALWFWNKMLNIVLDIYYLLNLDLDNKH